MSYVTYDGDLPQKEPPKRLLENAKWIIESSTQGLPNKSNRLVSLSTYILAKIPEKTPSSLGFRKEQVKQHISFNQEDLLLLQQEISEACQTVNRIHGLLISIRSMLSGAGFYVKQLQGVKDVVYGLHCSSEKLSQADNLLKDVKEALKNHPDLSARSQSLTNVNKYISESLCMMSEIIEYFDKP